MSGKSTPEDLDQSREPRFGKQRTKRQQCVVGYLQLARRLRIDNGLSTEVIDRSINQAEQELTELASMAGGRIVPRKRAKVDSTETCTVYIDECGAHSFTAKEDFAAFSLAAVIVRDQDRPVLNAKWRRWKLQNLGSENALVHEPEVRRRLDTFYRPDPKEQRQLLDSLATILRELEFAAVVCVIRREAYAEQFGDKAMDCSLPEHGYLLNLHFVAERIALSLQNHFAGGFFDPVHPQQYPDPQTGAREGLGFRVPLIVVSPYAKAGYISHTQHEIAGTLRLIEETFGIPRIGACTSADNTFADCRADGFDDMFDFTQKPIPFVPIKTNLKTRYFLNLVDNTPGDTY